MTALATQSIAERTKKYFAGLMKDISQERVRFRVDQVQRIGNLILGIAERKNRYISIIIKRPENRAS